MFCSFDRQPLILRLYGEAKTMHPRDNDWKTYLELFPKYTGARQIFKLDICLVQTSCGYAVPFYDYKGQRPTLLKSANKKGSDGIKRYWQEQNKYSIDGKSTGISES